VLVPGATPLIIPELAPTVTNVLLLLHVPPVIPALKPRADVAVPHKTYVPVITGTGFTVTVTLFNIRFVQVVKLSVAYTV